MADYSMLGSFSTGGASSLNSELLQKLKDADTVAKIDPIDKKIDDLTKETEKMDEINEKIDTFYSAIKPFDLFNSSSTIFDQISASTTGDSVIFDAIDVSKLNEGTTTVNVTQLAQKDVYQTKTFTDPTANIDGGQDDGDKITLSINGTDYDFSTKGKSYEDLADDINKNSNFTASVEKVGEDEYRIIIKSAKEGEAITVDESNGVDLGITDSDGDGTADDGNHVLTAQNLKATIDGVDYDVASNIITVNDNLKITATKVGDASISVQKDYSAVLPAIETMKDAYNDLVKTITEAAYPDEGEDRVLSDPSSLLGFLNNIKQDFFKTTGDDNESLFGFGVSFDNHGYMTLDSKKMGEALTTNFDDIKSLFLGVPEDKGVGTMIKEYIDDAKAPNGVLDSYGDKLDKYKIQYDKEKEKAVKDLDKKYEDLGAKWASYGALISQMESSFGGLNMMIKQSIASK
jgi:flagellar hook-associated protein 2